MTASIEAVLRRNLLGRRFGNGVSESDIAALLIAMPAAAVDEINVLFLSWAIDEHSAALDTAFLHEGDGGCSDDCAGDIKTRYERLIRNDREVPA